MFRGGNYIKMPSKRFNQIFLLLGASTLLAISSCSRDDSVSPVVPTHGGETEQIGNEGGTVTLGNISITVPAGYLPESLPFTLTELKSFTLDASYTLDPTTYQPMGTACRFDTPLRSGVPLILTVSFKAEDIPSGFDAANLGVIQRVTSFPEAVAEGSRSLPQPEVHHIPLPAMVSPESGTVTFEVFGGGTYQLVAMSEPPETYPFAIETGGMKTTGAMGASEAKFEIVHLKTPAGGPDGYNMLVEEAIRAAYAKYQSMGFTLPQGIVRIVVVEFEDSLDCGSVPPDDPLRIELNYRLATPEIIRRTVPHEYFHCIQFYNSNPISTRTFWNEDTWFIEGSAEWATDEVYDAIPGRYSAPTADRFKTSLDAIPSPNGGYDTVAFWKWLEARNPGTIWTILEHQRLITSQEPFSVLDIMVINTNAVSYEASLREVRPNVPFLSFFRSSLFHKDYEQDEILVDGASEDLWGPNRLGPPRQLAPGLPETGRTTVLRKGEPGDRADNPKPVDYVLDENLAADVFVIKNTPGDNAVEGTLHVKFEPDADTPYEAAVIAYKGTTVADETMVVVTATQNTTARVAFDQDTEVAVIVVDPHWEDTWWGGNQCDIWVAGESPCGELPEPILEIDNVEALVAALETPPADGTIRLAPGTYYPPTKLWDDVGDPQPDTRLAHLMLDGVTLAGSGVEETTIIMTQDIWWSVFVRGDATIRDLTIVGYGGTHCSSFYVGDVRDFRMCNVVIENFSTEGSAIVCEAWNPGTFNISVYDCTLNSMTAEPWWTSGINISAWRWGTTAPTINLDLKKTKFYNWTTGVGFANVDPTEDGTMVVDTDCYFFSNVNYRVYEMTPSGGVEHCP